MELFRPTILLTPALPPFTHFYHLPFVVVIVVNPPPELPLRNRWRSEISRTSYVVVPTISLRPTISLSLALSLSLYIPFSLSISYIPPSWSSSSNSSSSSRPLGVFWGDKTPARCCCRGKRGRAVNSACHLHAARNILKGKPFPRCGPYTFTYIYIYIHESITWSVPCLVGNEEKIFFIFKQRGTENSSPSNFFIFLFLHQKHSLWHGVLAFSGSFLIFFFSFKEGRPEMVNNPDGGCKSRFILIPRTAKPWHFIAVELGTNTPIYNRYKRVFSINLRSNLRFLL